MGWAEVMRDPQDTEPVGTRREILAASQMVLHGKMKVFGTPARLRAA